MVDHVKITRALAEPIRYNILLLLARSRAKCYSLPGNDDSPPGLCNCEIMAEFGMIQSRVSYHMKELVDAGLVLEEPRGKWKFYAINHKTFTDYIEQLKQDFCPE